MDQTVYSTKIGTDETFWPARYQPKPRAQHGEHVQSAGQVVGVFINDKQNLHEIKPNLIQFCYGKHAMKWKSTCSL